VLEPIFEADMLDCSFGFRPRRSAHDALQVLIDESWKGRRWVVETDIANCFEAIPHAGLMQAIEERVCDRAILGLVRGMLRAGVMEAGSLRHGDTGTPQGGVISPLLCNVYLHRLDRAWATGEHGVLVRYADDALVMCKSKGQAEAALARLTVLLAELGLKPKAAKTRIVHLAEGEEGFDFLGFHHRLVRGRTNEPATGSGRSPAGGGSGCRSRTSSGTSTCSCAAGRDTSATATPPASLARSGTTPSSGSRSGCPSRATGDEPGDGASNNCSCRPTGWA
jgi:RNA-directed DNA polymerase